MKGFAKETSVRRNEAGLLAAQLFIQQNLDKDLNLNAVSRVAGMSASHFHRLFRSSLGETPKRYIDRLRVEKSIYDIRISSLNLLEISLRYGFKNPETYCRVFKRHFGHSPSVYLRGRMKPEKGNRPKTKAGDGLRYSRSGNYSVTRLDVVHLAFIRQIGKYYDVPLVADSGENPWRELTDFARSKSLSGLPPVYIGIPHDNPSLTDPLKQRFDMCIKVDRPFRPSGRIGYAEIPAGVYGTLTYAGPYAGLPTAYTDLFNAGFNTKGFDVDQNPIFELMIDVSATTIADYTWTELYIPLIKKGVPE